MLAENHVMQVMLIKVLYKEDVYTKKHHALEKSSYVRSCCTGVVICSEVFFKLRYLILYLDAGLDHSVPHVILFNQRICTYVVCLSLDFEY